MTSPVNVDVKLGVNKFNVDEDSPHIILKTDPDNSVRFDYAGCLECGTCRILGLDTALEKWEYPRGTFGVEFRYG